MNPYPHNTINFIPPNNTFYDNMFSQNTIDNNLFSYNVDNKVNQEKRRIRKAEETDFSNQITLDDVYFNIYYLLKSFYFYIFITILFYLHYR